MTETLAHSEVQFSQAQAIWRGCVSHETCVSLYSKPTLCQHPNEIQFDSGC